MPTFACIALFYQDLSPTRLPTLDDVTVDSLKNFARDVLREAKACGADQAEVAVSAEQGQSVTVRMGALESIERQRDQGVALTIYKNQRRGSATTTQLDQIGVRGLVEKSLSIAGFTEPDTCAGLADPDRLAESPPDLDLYHPWTMELEEAEALARGLEERGRSADSRIDNSEGASVTTGEAVRVLATSAGFCEGYRTTSHSMGLGLVASEAGQMERDYWFSVARRQDDLDPVGEVAARAAERTLRRLGARPLPTQKAQVLYPPELARGVFGHLVAALSGSSQYRRASCLLDSLGERKLARTVNLVEQPRTPRAIASAAYDSDGVATAQSPLVVEGRIERYVLSTYSGRRLGLPSTANAGGVRNLVAQPTAGDLGALIKQMGRGLVVTELLGQGVNTVTGDYSRGASGLWVENGEIAYPVSQITVAGNLLEMFEHIVAIGNDVDVRSTIRSGSLLIDGMTVAGC